MKKNATEIVLTGGPCGGKTTALSYISEKLMDRGFRVFVVPEVATMFITGGIGDISLIAQNNPEKYLSIEREMVRMQMLLREQFNRLAGLFPSEKSVIIFDRGPMDMSAYMDDGYFEALLNEEKLTLHDVRDSFDGIIHLVTAAIGAEEFYTMENNKARRENSKEAKLADKKIMDAWVGHPHLRIIDNSTGFEAKMKRAMKTISRVLGIPVPLEIERKFLLKREPDLAHAGFENMQRVSIEQMYLVSREGREIRIRKRTQGGSATYYRTEKLKISPGMRHETEKMITATEYLNLKKLKDPATRIIRKNRHCFVYENQYFELDFFLEPPGLCILEIELTEENDTLALPPFVSVDKEVTDDSSYFNYNISKKAG